ncbi:hypothetical protein [Hyphobacterium sp.]|uniref:hypothetical protein n=1 Tax=Hyphobacterium sp. TaxID=2004662 RepID=UPI003B51C351
MSEVTYSKEDYRTAKGAVSAAETAMKATPEWQAYNAAALHLDEVADTLSDIVSTCEGCLEPVFDDEPYSHDAENGLTFCEACTPTWEILLTEPEHCYRIENGEPVAYTRETAKAAVDRHIANGGKLTDKLGLVRPERSDD